jgi:hypothetical protein
MESSKSVEAVTEASEAVVFSESMPGELVLGYSRDDGLTDYCFEYRVHKVTGDSGEVHYIAFTPYRAVVWTGSTVASAVAGMLHGLADLARKGSLNPSNPHDKGALPVQHAIHILSERLVWQVERRHESLRDFTYDGPFDPDHSEPYKRALAKTARDNEVISALATSIAALARVKDL